MAIGYEFEIVTDLYNEKDGELILVKKGLTTKWYCKDLSRITDCEQTYNELGNIRTLHTKIIVGGEDRIVKMRYNKVKQLITDYNKIGFK